MPTYSQPQTYLTFYAVKGEDGALSFPVMPGQKVLLIDSENAVIYVKSANALGQALPLEIYDLVQRHISVEPTNLPPAITKEEINDQVNKAVRAALQKYFPQIDFKD